MKILAEKRFNKRVFLILLLLGVLFYFLPGEWIKLEKDSTAYLTEYWREGVMPFYPFFLNIFRHLLGEDLFLNGVVIAQSLLAILCTMIFVYVLQKQFGLTEWECILMYLISMLPFSIYLPECGITHQIMTEGITYALFYLYFTVLMKGVWSLKTRWYLLSVLGVIFLCLIRSQMIFLLIIEVLLLGWIVLKKATCGKGKKFVYVSGAIVAGVLIALSAYKVIYGIVGWSMQIQNAGAGFTIESQEDGQHAEDKKKMEDKKESDEPETKTAVMREATSQFSSLILSKGFFEADPEDENLFEDKLMKEIFRKTYKRMDEEEHLYIHAKPGLYMWEDLVYDKVAIDVALSVLEYDTENPGVRKQSLEEICRELGVKTLFKHLDRYLYHAIRLMMPSFIAAVFFQIRPIYLFCHFITLFIYLFAIFEMIFSVKKHVDRHKIEFMAAIFGFIFIMVIVINIVFMGIQRYMVYGMGIFYCALYLLTKETILLPLCGWLKKDKKK